MGIPCHPVILSFFKLHLHLHVFHVALHELLLVQIQHQVPVVCDALLNVAVILALHHAERRDQEPAVPALQFKPVAVNGVVYLLRGVAHELMYARTVIRNQRVVVVRPHNVGRRGLAAADLNARVVYDAIWRDVVAGQQQHVPLWNRRHEFR